MKEWRLANKSGHHIKLTLRESNRKQTMRIYYCFKKYKMLNHQVLCKRLLDSVAITIFINCTIDSDDYPLIIYFYTEKLNIKDSFTINIGSKKRNLYQYDYIFLIVMINNIRLFRPWHWYGHSLYFSRIFPLLAIWLHYIKELKIFLPLAGIRPQNQQKMGSEML